MFRMSKTVDCAGPHLNGGRGSTEACVGPCSSNHPELHRRKFESVVGCGLGNTKEPRDMDLLRVEGFCTLTISRTTLIVPIATSGNSPAIGDLSLETGIITHVDKGRIFVEPGPRCSSRPILSTPGLLNNQMRLFPHGIRASRVQPDRQICGELGTGPNRPR